MDTISYIVCFYAVLYTVTCKNRVRQFPPGFKFGASSSAFQIEGAWNEDGKAPSIWDVATHKDDSPVEDGSNADVSADSYHNYKQDVEIIKELGLDMYHFSIAWTRILPNGYADQVNKFGVAYYNNLINELINNKIEPFVTIYHWDLPDSLQKIGGWTNSEIVNIFADYAKVLFNEFGDRVKYWITINDPNAICEDGYGSMTKAPMLNMSGIADYMCSRHVLLAHAQTYHLYDDKFRKIQNGSIGIAVSHTWYEPTSDMIDDVQAAIDAKQFNWGQFDNPIFSKGGDYPQEMKDNIASKSAEQNYPRSRLIPFSAYEVKLIRGSADFLGVNAFTSKMVYRDASLEGLYDSPSFMDDMGAVIVKNKLWHQSASSWLHEVPWGFFKLFIELKELYDNPPIYVTKNGWSTTGGLLDESRIAYMKNYLSALLDAIDEGCDIRGYFVWSLIDNFEWMHGYKEKFGLYEVDYHSVDKTRTPRKSAFVYKEITRTKTLDIDFEPDSYIVESRDPHDKDKDLD